MATVPNPIVIDRGYNYGIRSYYYGDSDNPSLFYDYYYNGNIDPTATHYIHFSGTYYAKYWTIATKSGNDR